MICYRFTYAAEYKPTAAIKHIYPMRKGVTEESNR